jgi:hypothetical protein
VSRKQRALSNNRTPIWDDRGRSESFEFTVSGRTITTPKRWTRRWLQSLINEEFWALEHRMIDEGYWSPMNLRTLADRKLMVFKEGERRFPHTRCTTRTQKPADASN